MGAAADGGGSPLLPVTAALLEAVTPDQVAEVALSAGLAALGASRGIVLVLDGDGRISALRAAGLPPHAEAGMARAPRDRSNPIGAALADRAPVIVEGPEELAARFPAVGGMTAGAVLALPLLAGDRDLGVLGVAYDGPRAFGARERALAAALAALCAQALDRARLFVAERVARAEAVAAQRRLAFLDELSTVLAGAFEEGDVLGAVVRLAVPALGDAAAAFLARDAVPAASAGPAALVAALAEAAGGDLPSGDAAAVVSRAGAAGAPAPGEVAVVALRARDHDVGRLAIASADPLRRFGPPELSLLALVARRAALAVDNARLYREAQAAVRARDEFLQIAAHDLRSPVAAVRLQVQSAARAPTPKDAVARLARADRAVARLSRLLDALLDVSRIGAGRLALDREPGDLAAITREAVARAAEEAAEAGCAVTVDAPAPVPGRWDRGRVEQVVANLLENALKYGRGRPVVVTVRLAGDRARLAVADRGIGIADGDRARIFERFERAAPGRKYGGLGLGLWIVRRIVEAHGGAVAVESAPGEGATFTVELPAG